MQEVVLKTVSDPVTYYGFTNPQRVTLDTGSTMHFVINSRRAILPIDNEYNFTNSMKEIPISIYSRISPVSVSARLTIYNINKYNNQISITSTSAPNPVVVTLTPGCYSPEVFATTLQTELNAALAAVGKLETFTITYNGASDTFQMDIGAGYTFHINPCTFLIEGRYLMKAPHDIIINKRIHTFTDISMTYSRYIHVSSADLISKARYPSYGGGNRVFLSIAWGEPWIKNKSFGAGSAFTSSHFISDGQKAIDTAQIALLDEFGHYLAEYCGQSTSNDFSMVIALSR